MKFNKFSDGFLVAGIISSVIWLSMFAFATKDFDRRYGEALELVAASERKVWAAQKTVTLFGDIIFNGPRSEWEQCVLGGKE